MIYFAFLLLSVVYVSNAVTTEGYCDKKLEPQGMLNFYNYIGLWYETHRYDDIGKLNAEDVTEQHKLGNDPHMISTIRNMGVINKVKYIINGTIEPNEDGTATGDLSVTYPDSASPYWILSTDYMSYSVVYSCMDNKDSNTKNVTSWLLSRTPKMPAANMIDVDETIARVNLKMKDFKAIPQSAACNSATVQELALAASLVALLSMKFL